MIDRPKLMTNADKEAQCLAVPAPPFIQTLASELGVEPEELIATVFRTCMYEGATKAEFHTFLAVASQYQLNPFTGEIYAFPKKGGGIQAIAGANAWNTMNNRQGVYDGRRLFYHYRVGDVMERFETPIDSPALVMVECHIFRKDHGHAEIAFAKMSEYKRNTSPWSTYPTTMLEHKAFIKASKAAFGFAGVVDADTAKEFCDLDNVPPMARADMYYTNEAGNPERDVTPQPEKPEPSGRSKASPPPAKDAPAQEEGMSSKKQRGFIIGLFYKHTTLPKPKNGETPVDLELFLEERGTPYVALTLDQASELIEAWTDKEAPLDLAEVEAFMAKYHPPEETPQDGPEPEAPGEDTPEAENGAQEPSTTGQPGLFSDLNSFPFDGDEWPKGKQSADDKRDAVMAFMGEVAEANGFTWPKVADIAAGMFKKELKKLDLKQWRTLHNALVE